MSINITEVLSNALSFLHEENSTLRMKKEILPEGEDLELFIHLISDLSFQVDFCLISSITQIQEIYDSYRNKQAEESNIQIRTLLNLATHLHNRLQDEWDQGWFELIYRLTMVLTLHSSVDKQLTCQDESILDCMSVSDWKTALTNNPWLVAAVCIQMIPTFYILQLVTDTQSEKPHET